VVGTVVFVAPEVMPNKQFICIFIHVFNNMQGELLEGWFYEPLPQNPA
jgi:hypothetical protein